MVSLNMKKLFVAIGLIIAVLFATDLVVKTNSYLGKTKAVRKVAFYVQSTRWLAAQREALNMQLLRDGAILLSVCGGATGATYVFYRKHD